MGEKGGEIAEADALVSQVEDAIPLGDWEALVMLAVVRERAYRLGGDLTSAMQACKEMETLGRQGDNPMSVAFAMCARAEIRKLQGRLRHAESIYKQVGHAGQSGDQQRLVITAFRNVGLADLLLERNELGKAVVRSRRAVEALRRIQASGTHISLVLAYSVLVRVLTARGEFKAARQAVWRGKRAGERENQLPGFMEELSAASMGLWIASGDLARAAKWGEEYESDSGDNGAADERLELSFIRLLVFSGRVGEAIERLSQSEHLAIAMGRLGALIQILAAKAVALAIQNREPEALNTLTECLCLASPEGYRRSILHEGAPVANLLKLGVSSGTWRDEPELLEYAMVLLAAFEEDTLMQIQVRQRR